METLDLAEPALESLLQGIAIGVAESPRQAAIVAFEARIGYVFSDRILLDQALTHASAGEGARRRADNERLEFLGDRILGLMVAEALMKQFPQADEGDLSARLHGLVSRQTCAEIATELGLGSALRLAEGQSRAGGRQNINILGNALEAVMAALYLDGGYEAVKRFALPFWQGRITTQASPQINNPKSFIQEWAAAQKRAKPVYEILERHGPDHAPVFTIRLSIEGFEPVICQGRSRQEAEKNAALHMIEKAELT